MSLSSRNPNLPWSSLKNKPFVTVTPNGPDDGGDYGPNTQVGGVPTTTCGIQEAINSLRYTGVSTGGGLVRIKGQLTLPANTSGITLYPGIGLEGQGPLAAFQDGTSVINVPASVNVPVVTVLVDPNVTGLTTFPWMQNLAISGFGGSSTGQHGIYVNGSPTVINDFYMSHVLIYDMGGDGLRINNGGKQYFYDCYMEDNIGNGIDIVSGFLVKVSRCYIYGNQGTAGIYGANPTYLYVDGCEIWGNYADGLYVTPQAAAAGYAYITNNRFQNNSALSSANGSDIHMVEPTIYNISGNAFEDTRGTKFTAYHVNLATNEGGAGSITNNMFLTGKPVTNFFNFNTSSAFNVKIANNPGYNPVGLIASPFDATDLIIGAGVNSANATASPTASKLYVVSGTDLLVTSTGGSSVSITIEDNLGNTVSSGGTTLPVATPQYLPVGWKINWGAFTGTVTAKVYGL